jgi:hypothetical protein
MGVNGENMVYIGVDPGRKGAISVIDNGVITIFPMPPEQNRGLDLEALHNIVVNAPEPARVGIEWNTARPNEVPDFAFRFGLQSGELRATFFHFGYDPVLVPPQIWMAYLGVPGKDYDAKCQQRRAILDKEYPQSSSLWLGPRGGVLDGPVEASCIALYMKRIDAVPFKGKRPPTFRGLPADKT